MKQYYLLITSLPRHHRQYKMKETPISRIQLEKRLKLLTHDEQHILFTLINCLWNSWFNLKLPFRATIEQRTALLKLQNPFINDIIKWFFDIRSIFTALRLRQIQRVAPDNPQDYWSTSLTTKLIKNWDKPDFGLKYTYPWLAEVNAKITTNDTAFIEDTLLTVIWKHLEKMEDRHFFDFEALIIYLLRWNIVHYWSQLDEKLAAKRIQKMTDQILIELE